MKINDKLTSAFGYYFHPKVIGSRLKHRQARLLAWIYPFLILFSIATLVIVLIFNPHHDPVCEQYAILISFVALYSIFSHILNSAGYYNISAFLLVAGAAIIPWTSLLFDPSIHQGDFVPLTYTTFSILLSSILLSTSITIMLAVLQFSGVALVLICSPAILSFNWFSFLSFVFLTSVFSILANTIIQRDIKQIANQTRQLAQIAMLLREQSIRDYLTNLFNRRYMEVTLKREIERGARNQTSIGIVMFDIDQFKRINDTLGHAAGDTVMKQIGKFLIGQIRKSDIACRYGGDEFILVLPDIPGQATIERAEQIRNGVKALDLPVAISISIGVAIFPDNGADYETLLKYVDNALYRAKRDGGDRVVWQAQVAAEPVPL